MTRWVPISLLGSIVLFAIGGTLGNNAILLLAVLALSPLALIFVSGLIGRLFVDR